MTRDPVAAGLRLLARAAADARQAAGMAVQVEVAQRHRTNGLGPAGFGMIGRFDRPGASAAASRAIQARLDQGRDRHDALLEALGPGGEAAAIHGLAWAWRPAQGFRLLRTGPTPPDPEQAGARWIQRTADALARGEWPLRPEDCASAHQRLRRAQAGAWDGAAQALAADWDWNPLLQDRIVRQLRRGRAALWHVPGIVADGPPLVLAAAAW